MTLAVLVVGGALTPPAADIAQARGLTLVSSKPYPTTAELIAQGNEVGAQGIVVRLGRVPREAILGIPSLKVIAKHGVGVDGIDVEAASERGIPVLVAGGANAQSVAEQTLALLMSVARATPWLDRRMREGHWDKSSYTGTELRGKSVGLVGLGAIGQAFLDLLVPFAMQVRIYDPYLPADRLPAGAQRCDGLADLLAASDIVSLHCPLTPENRGLIGAEALAGMRKDAILINTARGGLIDEVALIEALRDGRLGGAGLDTFATEPPRADDPLWQVERLVVSPHVGANTHEARDRVGMSVAEQVADYLATQSLDPRNLVNPAASIAA